MKKPLLLLFGLILSVISVLSQKNLQKINGADKIMLNQLMAKHKKIAPTLKNLSCYDTLRYAEAKEQFLTVSPNYYFLELWKADNEEVAMTYLSSFTNSIHGVEFLARKNSVATPANILVQASIYSVNQSFDPNTLIGSATINISNSTNFQYYTVNFPVPLMVSGNYCVVIKPVTTNGIIDIVVNDVAVTANDEMFCRFKSDYYASSGGLWIAIPSFSEFVIQPANFEPLVAPIVSYPLSTQISANEQIICENESLTLNSQISPNGIYGNRFYNWYSFLSHFNIGTIDSTLQWETPGSTIANTIYGTQTNVQYNSAAQFNTTLVNDFGFYSSCLDQDTMIITINEPNTNAGDDLIICEGESVTLTASGANSYSWNNNVTNGVPFNPTFSSQFIVEGQSQYGCVRNDTLQVTVNPITNSVINAINMDSLEINGTTYYESGTYYQTLTNLNGCDSLITINLTINHTGIETLNLSSHKSPLYYLDLNGKVISPRKNIMMFAIMEDGTVIRVFEID
jgi:hypothetical protein